MGDSIDRGSQRDLKPAVLDDRGARVNNAGSGAPPRGENTMRKAMFVALAAVAAMIPAGAFAGSPDAKVKAALEAADVPFEVDADGDYKVLVNYKSEGRTQLVYVRSAVETWGKYRVREVWSYAYEAPSDTFGTLVGNRLLDASYKLKLGSWVKQNKRALMVVKVDADAGGQELHEAISFAAEVADEMEKELTDGKDEF
jgi:hypothetical protein